MRGAKLKDGHVEKLGDQTVRVRNGEDGHPQRVYTTFAILAGSLMICGGINNGAEKIAEAFDKNTAALNEQTKAIKQSVLVSPRP